MKQKRVFLLDSIHLMQTGIKCLALLISCFILPVLSGICPDITGSTVSALSAVDCSLPVPFWKDHPAQTISEKDFPEEEGIRFEVSGPLRLTGKQNSQGIQFRKTCCNALPPTAAGTELPLHFSRKQSHGQLFSFQSIQSATLPARAGPLLRLIQDG